VGLLDRFQQRLVAFEPGSDTQKIIHAETLRAYNQMVLARRLRLDFVGAGLPAIIWLVLILGGLISIVVSQLYPIQDARYQGVLTVCLASFIGLVILVILGLDQPFRGDLGVGPESMELVYNQLMKR
jgi:vacuolar-type H+-ATPase subunit I/STV1